MGLAYPDRIGTVGAVRGDVSRLGAEPLAPRAVFLLRAHEDRDVLVALPGHAEGAEWLVLVELLDGAGAVAGALGGDGRVIDDDGFTVAEAGGVRRRLDGATLRLGAQDVVAAEGCSRDESHGGQNSRGWGCDF